MAELLRFPGLEIEVQVHAGPQAGARVRLDGADYVVSELQREGSRLSFVYAGQRYRFDVLAGPRQVSVADAVADYRAERLAPGAEDAALLGGELVSKMPGKVLQLLAAAGDAVEAGAPLLILEAMKMEHQVAAPSAGTVNGYPVSIGQRVMPGDLLVDFTPAG